MEITQDFHIAAWRLAAQIQMGLWEHYKGGRYTALGIVTHHETRLPMVKYVSHTYGGENVRPVLGWAGDPDGWCDTIEGEARFRYIGPVPSDIPLKNR